MARAYAIYALLAYLALIFYEEFQQKGRRRDLVLHVVAGALSVYTHYFGALYLVALWLAAAPAEYRAHKKLMLAPLGVGLLCLPLLPLFAFQFAHGPRWLDGVDTSVLFASARFDFFELHPLPTAAAAIFFLLGLWHARKHELFWTFFPLLAALALSFLLRPVYGDRFFLPSTIGIFSIVAVGMERVFMRGRAARMAGLLLAMIATACSLAELKDYYRDPRSVNYREAARAISEGGPAKCGRSVLTSAVMAQRMPYYLREFRLHNWESEQLTKPYWLFIEEGYLVPAYLSAIAREQAEKIWSSRYFSVFCVSE